MQLVRPTTTTRQLQPRVAIARGLFLKRLFFVSTANATPTVINSRV
jgi:hypothetical protein